MEILSKWSTEINIILTLLITMPMSLLGKIQGDGKILFQEPTDNSVTYHYLETS